MNPAAGLKTERYVPAVDAAVHVRVSCNALTTNKTLSTALEREG